MEQPEAHWSMPTSVAMVPLEHPLCGGFSLCYPTLAKLPGWHQPGVSQYHLGHACFSFTCFAQVAQVWSTLERLSDPILVPDILPAWLHAASQEYLAYAYSHLQLSCLGDSGVELLQLFDLGLSSSHLTLVRWHKVL